MTVCLRGSAMQSSSPTEPTPRPRRSKHHQCPIPSIPNAPRVPAQGPVQPSRRTPSTVPAARGRNSELSSHDASRPEHALVHLQPEAAARCRLPTSVRATHCDARCGLLPRWFQQTIAAVQQCGDRAPCRMSGAAQRMASVTSRAQRSVRRSSPPNSRKRGSDMLAALGKDSTLSPNRPIACQPGHDPAWQPHEQDAATRDERPRPAVRRNSGFVHAGSRDGNGMNRVSYSSRRGGGACGHYQCAGSACWA